MNVQMPPQHTHIVVQQHTKPPDTGVNPYYYGKVSVVLGVIQLVIGLIMLGLQLALTSEEISLHYVGSGYWCGIFVILIGALGIAAGLTKRKGVIIAFMTCSIICTVLVWCVIIANLISAGVATANGENSSYDFAMAGLAGLQFIIAIVSSGFGCGGVCCCLGPSQPQVVYQQAGQAVIVQGPGGVQHIHQQQGPIQGITTLNNPGYTTQIHQPPVSVPIQHIQSQPPGVPYNESRDYQALIRKPATAPPMESQDQPPPYISVYRDSNEGYAYPDAVQPRVDSGSYEQPYVPPDPSTVYEEIQPNQ